MILTQEILLKKSKNKFYQNILKTKNTRQDFSDIFIYEPVNAEEICLGNLYIISELVNIQTDSNHLINLLPSVIKREYYAQSSREPFNNFELSLKKTNSILTELIQKTDSKKKLEWFGKLNCLCAVLHQDQLHLTKTGEFKVLLFRENTIIEIDKKLNRAMSQNTNQPNKIFQGIISGKLEIGDKLIFMSTKLFDFFSPIALKQVFNQGGIGSMQEQINKFILGKEHLCAPAVALLMEITADEPIEEINSYNQETYLTPPISLDEIINQTSQEETINPKA